MRPLCASLARNFEHMLAAALRDLVLVLGALETAVR
jgi:hypothetical protein